MEKLFEMIYCRALIVSRRFRTVILAVFHYVRKIFLAFEFCVREKRGFRGTRFERNNAYFVRVRVSSFFQQIRDDVSNLHDNSDDVATQTETSRIWKIRHVFYTFSRART